MPKSKRYYSPEYLFFPVFFCFAVPSKGVNWDTWSELGQNLVNRHRCDCR